MKKFRSKFIRLYILIYNNIFIFYVSLNQENALNQRNYCSYVSTYETSKIIILVKGRF